MKRISLVGALALMVAALAPSSAQASTVTVGSPLTASFNQGVTCINPGCTWANTLLGESGANPISPIDGTIVRWRVIVSSGTNPMELRVLRPASGGQYTGAGTSSPGTPTGTGMQTFTAAVPIKAGDLIGLDVPSTDVFRESTSATGSNWVHWYPPLADGSTAAPNSSVAGDEVAFNADVQPQPGLSLISPTSGSIKGGTSLTITGHDFEGSPVTVSFGSAAATNVTVSSDTQITAISPPGSAPGAVDVRVTTGAGKTSVVAADRFTYLGCVVPKVKGTTFRRAKRKVRAAGCKLGKVKGPRSGRVKRQKPKPGTLLGPGSRVKLKLR